MGVKKTNFLKEQVKFTWGGWRQAHFECVSVNNTNKSRSYERIGINYVS